MSQKHLLLFAIIFLFNKCVPETINSKIVVFIAVKSGPGKKNFRYRTTARKTWLNENMSGVIVDNGFAYKFFVDGPCCEQENELFHDMVIRHRGKQSNHSSPWLHPSFEELYANPSINYKTQWERNISNYGRDWDIGIISWAVRSYQFSFILCIDDDALVCTQNLVFTLNRMPSSPFQTEGVEVGMFEGVPASLGGRLLRSVPLRSQDNRSVVLPGEHSPFVLGFPRWDSYDNCFVLMSCDVAAFFEKYYYSLLRPTHTIGDIGATLGAAWSAKHGRWSDMLRKYLSPHFVRKSGSPHCERCGDDLPIDHVCHNSPLVDHRPSSIAWMNYLKHTSCEKQFTEKENSCPANSPYCHCWGGNTKTPDPTRLCVDKLFIDKMKDMATLEGWWELTWPQNPRVAHEFKPAIAHLLSRDHRSSVKSETSCVPSILIGQDTEKTTDVINATLEPQHRSQESIAREEQLLSKKKAARKAKRLVKKEARDFESPSNQ